MKFKVTTATVYPIISLSFARACARSHLNPFYLLFSLLSLSVLTFIPVAMATTSLFLGCIYSFGCKTMKIIQFEEETKSTDTQQQQNRTFFDVGPWMWQSDDLYIYQEGAAVFEVCRMYSIIDKEWGYEYANPDSTTVALRAFSALAAMMGGFAVVMMCVAPCQVVVPVWWKTYGVLLLCASVWQGLCLIMPLSDLCTNNPIIQVLQQQQPDIASTFPDECVPSVGYNCGIVATVMYFVTGIVVMWVPPPRKVDDENWCLYDDNAHVMSFEDDEIEANNIQEVKKLMAAETNNTPVTTAAPTTDATTAVFEEKEAAPPSQSSLSPETDAFQEDQPFDD